MLIRLNINFVNIKIYAAVPTTSEHSINLNTLTEIGMKMAANGILLASLFLCCLQQIHGQSEQGASVILTSSIDMTYVAQWIEVKGWSTGGRNELFDTTKSLTGTSKRFTVSKEGIYFVSANILISDANQGIVTASVVVNMQAQRQTGISGLIAEATGIQTISISGCLRLFEGDQVSIYVYSDSDIDWKVLQDTSFNVRYLSAMSSAPGFQAFLKEDIKRKSLQRIYGWTTQFQSLSGFAASLGEYSIIQDGIYHISVNLLLRTLNNVELLTTVLINDTIALSLCIHREPIISSHLAGHYLLSRGDKVLIRVSTSSVEDFDVLKHSGLSVVFLSSNETEISGISSTITQDISFTGSEWQKVTSWEVSSRLGNYESQAGLFNEGNFSVQVTGIYQMEGVVYLKGNSSELFSLLIGTTEQNGVVVKRTSQNNNTLCMKVSGQLYLLHGSTLQTFIKCNSNSSFIIQENSSLSITYTRKDWPGFSGSLGANITINTNDWFEITSWLSSGSSGLFSFDHGFSNHNGRYTITVSGIYYISSNVIFSGVQNANTSLIIAIDGVVTSEPGLASVWSMAAEVHTLKVAGAVQLSTGQTVSVFARTGSDQTPRIVEGSGFSIGLIGQGLPTVPGFFAGLSSTQNFTSVNNWVQIGDWSSNKSGASTFFNTGQAWDSTTGQYTVSVEGIYIVVANIRLDKAFDSTFSVKIVFSSTSNNKLHPARSEFFKPATSWNPESYTLNIASTFKGTIGLNVSLAVKSFGDSEWFIHKDSSFGILLVSPVSDSETTGFMSMTRTTRTQAQIFSARSVQGWQTRDFKVFVLFLTGITSSDFVSYKGIVWIREPALYFVSINIYFQKADYYPLQVELSIDDLPVSGLIGVQQAFGNVSADSNSEEIQLAVSGVIYVKKDQKLLVQVTSLGDTLWTINKYCGFSIVKLMPSADRPSFKLDIESSTKQLSADYTTLSDWSVQKSSSFTSGEVLHQGTPSQIIAPLNGFYLVSSVLNTVTETAEITNILMLGNTPDPFLRITEDASAKSSYHFAMAGFVEVKKGDSMSLSLTSSPSSQVIVDEDSSFSSFLLTQNTNEENDRGSISNNQLTFIISEWQKINWSLSNSLVGDFQAINGGIYFFSVSFHVVSTSEPFTSSVKVNSEGITSRTVSLSTVSINDNSKSVLVSGIAALSVGETLVTYGQSSRNGMWNLLNSSSLQVILLSEVSLSHSQSLIKNKDEHFFDGKRWNYIPNWFSPPGNAAVNGRYTAPIGGKYLVCANIIIYSIGQENISRIFEAGVVVDGDLINKDGVIAMSSVAKDSFETVSVTTVLFLQRWQTLSVVVYSDLDGEYSVLENSSFHVTLLDPDVFYDTSFTEDNGPRIGQAPEPSSLWPAGIGYDVSLTCDAVALDTVTYNWMKNYEFLPGKTGNVLDLPDVTSSDDGIYTCIASADGVRISSQDASLLTYDPFPRFNSSHYSAKVFENTCGISLVDLRAYLEKDDGKLNSAMIRFQITKGNVNDSFSMDPALSSTNSTLFLNKKLNREECDQHHLEITATNTRHNVSTLLTVTVIVLDLNDNSHVFTQRFYNATVPENTTVGYKVFQPNLTDVDLCPCPEIYFTLYSTSSNLPFQINSSSGAVTVKDELDFETRHSYVIIIEAKDEKFTSSAILEVYTSDINDNQPVFGISKLYVTLPENAPLESYVIRVEASDLDSGINSNISYFITSGNSDDCFAIDESTGIISLKKRLDFETNETYELIIVAKDHGLNVMVSLPLNVEIGVIDVNDNAPQFDSLSYNLSISESTGIGTSILKVHASDSDSSHNGQVTYSIKEPITSQKFIINETTGSIETISKLSPGTYSFILFATDHGESPLIGLTIVVVIVTEDNTAPKFVHENMEISVLEDVAVGTVVAMVTANDANKGMDGEIRYSIYNQIFCEQNSINNSLDIFAINSTTGAISTKANLDRETADCYVVRIQAADHGSESLQAFANLTISVSDVNDNSPIFGQHVYNVELYNEASDSYFFILNVSATDRDIGLNKEFVYSVVNTTSKKNSVYEISKENFIIDQFGVIMCDVVIPKGYQIELTVAAIDRGIPRLTGQALVKINVVKGLPSRGNVSELKTGCEAMQMWSVILLVIITIILLLLVLFINRQRIVDCCKTCPSPSKSKSHNLELDDVNLNGL